MTTYGDTYKQLFQTLNSFVEAFQNKNSFIRMSQNRRPINNDLLTSVE